MKVTIVLISGKQGSGKDTLAHSVRDRLDEADGIYCHKLKFADALYAMHDAVYGVGVNLGIFEQKVAKDGKLLQVLGTEWGRAIDPNIWVKGFAGSLKKVIGVYKQIPECKHLVVFVTDCRFENEFDCMDNAVKVRLECDREKRKARADKWRDDDSHASEISLDKYASQGKFDLYLDTGNIDADKCADVLQTHLDIRV